MSSKTSQFSNFSRESAKSGKEQVDAFATSGNLLMKGLEHFTQTCVALAQSSAERNNQAVKEMMGCKTISELTETQNKWMQQNLDDLMATGTTLSELGIKLTTEMLEPINDQLSKTVQKAGESFRI